MADTVKAESVRKVLRIVVRRASSLPNDVDSSADDHCGRSSLIVDQQRSYNDECLTANTAAGSRHGADLLNLLTSKQNILSRYLVFCF